MKAEVTFTRLRDLWSISQGDVEKLAKQLGIVPGYVRNKILGHKAWFADEMNALADEIARPGIVTVTPAECIELIGEDLIRVRGTLADQ